MDVEGFPWTDSARDCYTHYMLCPVLWRELGVSFDFAEHLLERMCFRSFSREKPSRLAMATQIYHAAKHAIGGVNVKALKRWADIAVH